jgi:D-alanyl-D-alanine-carboxypeptidase/D-alanyl-D-alanine-endopeptidase
MYTQSLAALLLALPLAAFAQAPAPKSPLDGIWLGTLHTGGPNLRLQFRLHQDAAGKWACLIDSIDQNAPNIPCAVGSSTNPINIDVPLVHGNFTGKLTGDTLDGQWTQGPGALPLKLERQTAALAPPPPPKPDPAMPPVALDQLKSVLDTDLAVALKSGALAPGTNAGITIGVLQNGQRKIFSYGTASNDSVFEIGSITKTFTATILAQMVEQHQVQLKEPVRELLPPGTVTKPASGAEITLLDLSTQHSGLPRMPDNFHPADPSNPFADYDAAKLYAFIGQHGLAVPANPTFLYSNLGVGLLGQALADRAGMPYPELLQKQVTGPLGMTHTAVVLTPDMRAHFLQGNTAAHRPAHAWDLVALAGAGGIRSNAADMLTYLDAQLHPAKLPAAALSTSEGKTLSAAIADTHMLHAEAGPGQQIALNWFHNTRGGGFWHNGATGGYTAYAFFNPEKDFAIIVLSNTALSADNITDKLGQHIAQRLLGEPAVPLRP